MELETSAVGCTRYLVLIRRQLMQMNWQKALTIVH
uniref:Uncharacterized protein n=1 Tax=Arundo donax TaxID=35708 RepID=A0A0A9HTX6_ARUDO